MKKCIWCLKSESDVAFKNEAHTIPQALGGKNKCEDVCDDCNSFFGNGKKGVLALEKVLKEAFNVSRYILRTMTQTVNSKSVVQFKSELFSLDRKNNIISLRPSYSKYKQSDLGRSLRRCLYKIYLEERQRQMGDAFDKRFNFIRNFARYDKSNYPVYVRKSKHQAVFFYKPDVEIPQIRFTEYSENIEHKHRLYEYQLMGHSFILPTKRFYWFSLRMFIKKNRKEGHPFGEELVLLKRFEDLDKFFNHIH